MKYLKITVLFCLSLAVFSCGDDDKQRLAENQRAMKQNDSILKILNSNWKFNIAPLSARVQPKLQGWNEWQQFKAELDEKPNGSIETYRQKVKTLATKADLLRNNIPSFFDKPQVRSRISVLITKVKSLYTYINISVIPDKKILSLINEITVETNSFQNQLDEIVRFSEIPKELGEEQMLRALDTVRHANPDMAPPPQGSTPVQSSPAPVPIPHQLKPVKSKTNPK